MNGLGERLDEPAESVYLTVTSRSVLGLLPKI